MSIFNDIIKMVMLHKVFRSGGKGRISYEEMNFIRRKRRGTQENAQTLQELPLGLGHAAFQGVDGVNFGFLVFNVLGFRCCSLGYSCVRV